MKRCSSCAEDVQDAALVCTHCGREMSATAPPAPISPSAGVPAKTSSLRRLARWVVHAGLACGAVTMIIAVSRGDLRSAEGDAPHKTLDVQVAWNNVAVEITNRSTAAGGEMTVYINGTPPFTYRVDARVPAVGEAVRIPLPEFVTRSGERFDPASRAVTVVWVGGGGFDFQSYRRR